MKKTYYILGDKKIPLTDVVVQASGNVGNDENVEVATRFLTISTNIEEVKEYIVNNLVDSDIQSLYILLEEYTPEEFSLVSLFKLTNPTFHLPQEEDFSWNFFVNFDNIENLLYED